MQQFIEKYREQIVGTLSGFDRLVFRGSLRRLNASFFDPSRQVVVAKGMEEYCWQNQILFKNYGDYVRRTSEKLKDRSLQPYRNAGVAIEFVRDTSIDKDQLARGIATKKGIRNGPACVLSTLEPSPTFDYVKSRLVRRTRPCHVLYHYQIHPELGWMYARIQTWFPFNLQIGLNGREWLARQMDREGLRYRQQDNCFAWIENYERAQELLSQQLQSHWTERLQQFVSQLNPAHEEIFARYPADYYWTCYQSEWATDMVFREGEFLKRLMSFLTPHGMLSYRSADVLRYFGRRVNRTGKIPAHFDGQLQTNLREYREGERVKYWLEGNSVKFYDKAYTEQGNVLRAAETTINNVSVFRSYRPKEGGSEEDLQWRPMRKGVADLNRRAEISQHTNERLVQALASVDDSRRLEELTAPWQQAVTWKGRRVRALRPFAEDQALLLAVNHGSFLINGFRNRDLQALLYGRPAESKAEQRRRSGAISRKLRLLRAHSVIHKVPHTHRYHVAPEARTVLVAILTSARTTLRQLNELQRGAA